MQHLLSYIEREGDSRNKQSRERNLDHEKAGGINNVKQTSHNGRIMIRDKVRHTDKADEKNRQRVTEKSGGRPSERKTKRSEIES